MRNIYLIFYVILFSGIFSQSNRSVIYYNGSPNGVETFHSIYNTESSDHRYGNQFSVNNDYILERLNFYFSFEEYPDSVFIMLQKNENNSPGDLIDQWQVLINQNYPDGYGYNVYTLDECIQLDINNTYWITVKSIGNGILKWNHTDEVWPNISSIDGGLTWNNFSNSTPGASIVYGERIYYQDPIWGDINDDLVANVADIVIIVQSILEQMILSEDQYYKADTNQDGQVDVIDILDVVNRILNTTPPMSSWLLEDINSNSHSFGEFIGPEIYNGDISVYYFGKAG